ncbi:hypothetical protein [Ferribacterium limneticum]|uniref:hypothetical protein n=1 Tax=Ferribacterium limneticum TaxID=76259 RepID=UPI001CFA2283|nr:hypothetical protein [Ferribacterium limneticum]UCV17822.1 hypothetical protein KI610_13460 [Ferribacterium limneticum]
MPNLTASWKLTIGDVGNAAAFMLSDFVIVITGKIFYFDDNRHATDMGNQTSIAT